MTEDLCKKHHERYASGRCAGCWANFCSGCLSDVDGYSYCPECVEKAREKIKTRKTSEIQKEVLPTTKKIHWVRYTIVAVFLFVTLSELTCCLSVDYGIVPRSLTQPYLLFSMTQSNPPGEIRKRETEHFVIYHRNDLLANWLESEAEDDLEMIAEDMDQNIPSMMRKGKFTITIARTPSEFKKFAPHASSITDGFAVHGTHNIVINQMEAQRMLHITLAHELTHFIYGEAVNDMEHIPEWVNEGVACYEASKIDNVVYLQQRDMVSDAYRSKSFVSLKVLQTERKYINQTDLFYAESACAVDFLIESHGMRKFLEFSRILQSGQNLDYAFSAVYSPDINSLDDFEKQWIDSIKQ